MPLIPAAQLESIKRDVSCRSVLEASGAEFVKHGADVVCRCPFHDDRTPSLVVNERKNLWKCHGACGVGGDVIALTMKLRGVSFRHAAELLAEGLGGDAAASSFAAAAGKPVARSTSRVLPCPLDAGADDAGLLNQVVAYYARRLDPADSAGRAYLRSRGLDDADLIRRFAIGFADRSLGLRLPNKQRVDGEKLRARLESLGLFRASGHEHFAGSVVVPIHGADGAVVGMYGRKVTGHLRSGTPNHTYLAGKHRGVWNYGPDLVADGAVVICEALLDAMSCWKVDVRHVTAAYGVNGWTDDHDAALRTWKARDVFVAFDADAAGDAAASTRCDLLIAAGYTAYRVQFAPGQDANDTMRGEGGDEALRAAIRGAVWVGGAPRVVVPAMPAAKEGATAPVAAADSFAAPAAPVAPQALPPGVQVQRTDADLFVTIGTRRYRLRGWERGGSGEALTVALRLSVATAEGERLHHDRIDLYQTRQRSAFTAAAATETGLAAELIKADLGTLILAAEAAGLDAARRATAETAAPVPVDAAAGLTAEERTAALAWLRSPDLMGRIVADLTRCGLVGEDTNKLVAYLAASSRKLASPLAVVVQSSSAAGKSTLMDAVLALMPPEDVRQYSAISGKSPFYLGTENLKHRILAVAEEEGARRASYALKLLQSEGFLSMAATGKDPETGKLVTHDYRVEGPVMLMLTTTAIDVDPELMNRCLVLTVDEEPAQTAAIQVAQRQARTLDGLGAKRDRAAVQALHANAQRLLRQLAVVNPHAPALSFAAGATRLRRDHAKYLALIDTVTFLHQHQRAVQTHTFADGGTLDYIAVTPEDIAIANRLAGVVLARCLDDLPPQTRRVLHALHAWVMTASAADGVALDRFAFTRRQAREGMGIGQTQARLHLDRLAEHEFIEALRLSGDGMTPRYRLAWAPGVAGPHLGLAPTPTHPQAPAPTMHTCRDSGGPVGGLSGSTPTGQTTVNCGADNAKAGGCRVASFAHKGGYQLSASDASQAQAPAAVA